MGPELNVLALMKGNERYVYVYDDDSRAALLTAFQAQAADAELSLNFFDATVLSQKAREQAEACSPDGELRELEPGPAVPRRF